MSKRKDPVDFAVTSASNAELALRVNFIVPVIKEDVWEKLDSFLKQVLQSSVRDATACLVKLYLNKTSQTSTSYRYYEMYPIMFISPDPIRC